MSIGPCGDYLGITSKGVLTLSVIQVPFMLSTIIAYPDVLVDIYSSKVVLIWDHATNTTAVNLNHPTSLHYMHSVSISSVFIVCSALIAAFALFTYQITQHGVESTSSVAHEEFTNTNAAFVQDPSITMWNNVFTALVILSHGLLVAVLCTPNSLHFLLLIVLVFYISFSIILQPKIQTPTDIPASASSVGTTYLVAVMLYGLGMVYVCGNISYDPHQLKLQLITVFICIDFLLILGHTWDPTPLMSTIINCRFVYLICSICANAIIYIMWDRYLRIPYISV
jgi:hypothetical protein